MEYASKGLGTTAAVLGGSALGVSLLNGGLGNILNGGTNCHNNNSDDCPINRYEATLIQELAKKDSEIALRDATTYTLDKISQTKEYLEAKMEKEVDKIDRRMEKMADKEDCRWNTQEGVNREQAAYNAANTVAISCVKGQVADLFNAINDFSTRVVEERKVCDTCCSHS